MVTRRSMLVGSAAVLGALSVGTGTATAAGGRNRQVALTTALAQGAVIGFPLPGGLTCPVPYLSRAAWGANESWRFPNGYEDWPPEHHPVQALTVHHTGFAASADPAETIRTIYRQQALTSAQGGIQGWGDIGYNLLIDAAGVVYEGRHSGSAFPIFGPTNRLMTTGAHVQYYNTGNIGVCLLGYLNDAPPSQAAQDSLVTVLAYLAAVAGVNPLGTVNYYNPVPRPNGTHSTATVLGVSGHRNWVATDCPGHALYPLLGGIRQRAAAAMPSAPQPSQSEPAPTTQNPPQPTDTGQPTPTTTQDPPQPTDTGQPTQTATQNPPQPAPTTQNPPPPGGGGSSASERGGDEYVPAARIASPSQFPTVAPSPTSTVDGVATATTPSARATLRLTAPPTAPVASGVTADTPGWGVTATAVGVTVAGALGGWWWKRRRTASTTPTPDGPDSSIMEASTPSPAPADQPTTGQSIVDEPPTQPSPVDEPAIQASPVDEPSAGQSTVDESHE